MSETILKTKDLFVSFSVEKKLLHAVRGVSFSLDRGETLALVGESGSGKSVTSRAIMGLLDENAVTGGEVEFDGVNLLSLSERQMERVRGSRIAMVFQDPFSALDPIMRVGKQITEALIVKNRAARKGKGENRPPKLTRKKAKERAIELMREVGIPDAENRFYRYPFELSGGLRQRIVIAVALASDPEILVCDEPTTALDVSVQAQILELIDGLKRERGLSVLFITHDLGVVANIADKIAVLYAGKIVEYGTVEEIFYDARHPYTWALLSSTPDLSSKGRLEPIEGSPPDMLNPPKGDAFAPRNPYALEIDFEEEPPVYEVTPTHYAATWLLHPSAPKVERPRALTERIERMRREYGEE